MTSQFEPRATRVGELLPSRNRRQVFVDPSGKRRWKVNLVLLALPLASCGLMGLLAVAILKPAHLQLESLTPAITEAQTMIEGRSRATDPFKWAFLDSTWAAARDSLQRHLESIDGILSDSLYVQGNNPNILENQDPEQPFSLLKEIINTIRNEKPKARLVAMIKDTDHTFARLGDEGFTVKLVTSLENIQGTYQFDGFLVFLGQETGAAERGYLPQLIREMRDRLPGVQVGVSVNIAGGFNFADLSSVADLIVLRAEDEVGQHGTMRSWEEEIGRVAKQVPKEKLVIALNSHATDHFSNGTRRLSFAEAMQLARLHRSQVSFDPVTAKSSFLFMDQLSLAHVVTFFDAAGFWNQLTTARAIGPAGLALWELGAEDDAVWSAFATRGAPPAPDQRMNLNCSYAMQVDGAGEVYRFGSRPREGERELNLDAANKIIGEVYRTLPVCWSLQAEALPKGSLLLTFDDGPEEPYTSEVLDILRKERVTAVFFVVGTQALQNPGLIKRMSAEGHQLGNHTFSHPDLAKVNDTVVRLQLNANERLLQSLDRRSVRLFRPPFASDEIATTPAEAHVIELASYMGYLALGANINPEDWDGRRADDIVRVALARAKETGGSIIELHDGGGLRAETVKALPKLIEGLRAQGFSFLSAEELEKSLKFGSTEIPDSDSIWAEVSHVGFSMLSGLWGAISVSCAFVIALIFFRTGVLWMLAAAPGKGRGIIRFNSDPTVAVIIPAYNEANVILKTVGSVLASDYDNNLNEIIVVDDGSNDGTAELVQQSFVIEPRVRVIRKTNTGKADSLNVGIAASESEVLIMLDGDTLLDRAAVRLLAKHFADPKVGAVAGNAKVGNRDSLISKLQALEYVTSQNFERRALCRIGGITVVPGAIGAWRRTAVIKAGGLNCRTLAEDCDLTLAIQRIGFSVVHENAAVAWTEAPSTLSALVQQRFRWMYGVLQVAVRNSDLIIKGRPKGIALFSLPSLFVFSLAVPLVSPALDVLFLWAVSSGSLEFIYHPRNYDLRQQDFAMAAYLCVFAADAALAIFAFSQEPDENRWLLAYLPLQRFFYRQVLYFVALRVLLACLRGEPQGWNKLARTGTVSAPVRSSSV